MYTALVVANVRPIPLKAIGRENWKLLVPGYLALIDILLERKSDHSVGRLHRYLGEHVGSDFSEIEFIQLLREIDPDLVGVFSTGRIPGLSFAFADTDVDSWLFSDRGKIRGGYVGQSIPGLNVTVGARINGYLETCGCKVAQVGGLARRESLLHAQASSEGLALDCGSFLPGADANEMAGVDLAYLETVLEVFGQLSLTCATLAPSDVMTGLDFVLKQRPRGWNFPLLAANLRHADGTYPLLRYSISTVGDKRLALVGWVGSDPDIERLMLFDDGLGAYSLAESLGDLDGLLDSIQDDADMFVLFGEIEHRRLFELQATVQGFDIVVTSATFDANVAAFDPDSAVPGGWGQSYRIGDTIVLASLAATGSLSSFADVREGQGFDSQRRFVLDSNVPLDPKIESIVIAHDREFDATASIARHGPSTGGGFVGSKSCSKCHSKIYEDWKNTPHARAMQTLTSVRRNKNVAALSAT